MPLQKLICLNISEYNLIANKDPFGSYDRNTRENLYWIIDKLTQGYPDLSPLEHRLLRKFKQAQFSALEAKDKRVKLEVRRYQISNNVKRTLKIVASLAAVVILVAAGVYQFVLDARSRHEVQVAFYAELNRFGLVSAEDLKRIQNDLHATATELKRTKEGYRELNETIQRMILNNKVTENLKYIVKQIYQDPRTQYLTTDEEVTLRFNHKTIASYSANPDLWYLVGILNSGLTRVYYNNEELLEIETIFGRKNEETPLGEYEIRDRVFQPTWYKKEHIDGQIRVRAIKFGEPDHDIGRWWLGLNKLGPKVAGSYGIHGVNPNKSNEFFKKSFDWRNGSAGCPNIQAWYLDFLAQVVPVGTRVNIVQKDKWKRPRSVRFVPLPQESPA